MKMDFGSQTLERFEDALKHWNLSLDEVQRERFQKLTNLMLDWNERISLTTITDPELIAIEHYLDSVAPLAFKLISEEMAVIDVGTGAGFPGLPLAILCPQTSFTLVDATRKKVKYLQMVCSELGLTNVDVIWGRAEELAKRREFRESFDVALARAFGAIDIVWECTLPFVKVGGIAITYKGPKVDDELEIGKQTAPLVGGKVEFVHKFVLPTSDFRRALVIARKLSNTPLRFPRSVGIPEKRPLRLVIAPSELVRKGKR
ncbi:MAG: 16S rRNA (guanine(527)-N(7))-methyltransferase RsmG [Armatimonadetes bacterium]|nr:16S rRNA (guanine(527)-N(7))-methyltransferase RsmG [Armatimonadota bacterium]MDW8026926.1 16S rRNA (guanine(527)-N(7))-methyltransferase RsmG [Armatimonadota bacterium]